MKKGILFALLSAALLSAGCATADEWPSKTMTIVVPWKAGGGADSAARLVAKFWEKELGTKFVIENRKGADGMIGVKYYFTQPADCDHILFFAQPFYSNNILSGKAGFAMEDTAVINAIELDPSCLAVNPGKFASFEALNAAIKAQPGQIKIGVNGSSTHLVLAKLLIERYGWDVKMVYYGGAAESRAALMGGHVDVIATTLAGCVDEVPVIVGSYQRNARYPEVPTYGEIVKEENPPLFATTRYLAVSAKAAQAYPERYAKLVETMKKTFDSAEFKEALEKAGRQYVSSWHGPEASAKMNEESYKFAVTYRDVLTGK